MHVTCHFSALLFNMSVWYVFTCLLSFIMGGVWKWRRKRFLILLYFIIMASVLGMQVYGMHLLDGVGLIELLACRNE